MNVTVVTVTYGARMHLLVRALDAARAQGAEAAVVVDNGSADPVSAALAARYGGWARVEALGGNHGSALGYKTGIARAVAQGAVLILLLDDDNVPAPGCVRLLCEAWARAVAAGSRPDALAVHGVRCRAGQKPLTAFQAPRRGSFLGFHIAEVPAKLLRRVAPEIFGKLSRGAAATEINAAPYGGMLFHADLIGAIGLPDEAFFLYVDDYEFSSRISRRGGQIRLIRDALIEDIDSSWGSADGPAQSAIFTGRLEMRHTSKIYYATRNMVYFEADLAAAGGMMYRLNRIAFMLILPVLALPKRRWLAYRTILRGIHDGDRRVRGYNPAYAI